MTSYVSKYYPNSETIAQDEELQSWVSELQDDKVAVNGEVKTYRRCGWMNSFNNTPEMLSLVLASVILLT